MRITKRAAAISPSLTLEITAKAKKLKQQGVSVVSFGAGEPDFNTPAPIMEAAKHAMDAGYTKYTPASGSEELKKAVCDKLLKENGLSYEPSQIIVSCGAKHSLYNAMQALIEEGDEVILPSPFWLTYPELVRLCGGEVVYVETKAENAFKMTAKDFEKAITSHTKALILNSPNNPTGAVYTKEELFAIAEVAVKHGIFVISDEIYEKLVYEGTQHVSIATHSEAMKDLTVVINGMSKAFAMTGWRIGYLAAPKDVAKAISGIQSHETSNPCSIAQAASVVALTEDDGSLATMQQAFAERRKFAVARIQEMQNVTCVVPEGAFYIMVNVSACYGKKFGETEITGSVSFASALLNRGVAVIPGAAFGADDYVRLSYAISKEEIAEGLNRLESFIQEVINNG
ncbi:MAG: pyridoxal phosphate-dependent aminotransferase [Clostridiales bacterium]|nr:pyridoxal phosphate-dependent aminotransferase [Clostridiales bacterium]